MKSRDFFKEIRLLHRYAKVNEETKTIVLTRGKQLGLIRLARIDYFVNHCGFTAMYEDQVVVEAADSKEESVPQVKKVKDKKFIKKMK